MGREHSKGQLVTVAAATGALLWRRRQVIGVFNGGQSLEACHIETKGVAPDQWHQSRLPTIP